MKKSIFKVLAAVLAVADAAIMSTVAYADATVPSDLTYAQAYSLDSGLLQFGVNDSLGIAATESYSYPSTVSVLGIFPVKTVNISAQSRSSVVISGQPFGCILDTKHILVVGLTDVTTESGTVNPAARAGIATGDYLVSINGVALDDVSTVSRLVRESDGGELKIVVNGSEGLKTVRLRPAFSKDEQAYRLGVWIRDSEAGVGMLSFYSPESGVAAGLGHSLNDADTGKSFAANGGKAYTAGILAIKKGADGNPGQLCGCINSSSVLGKVLDNSEKGVYIAAERLEGEMHEVAYAGEVHKGDAELYVSLNGGTAQRYSAEITEVRRGDGKNLVIKVTDKELLGLTGGIVQGMSGAPILQDGRLAGVLTHVLVNDADVGYGIFAETMVDRAKEVAAAQKKAS